MNLADVSTPYSVRIPAWQRAAWEKCCHPAETWTEFSRDQVEQSIVQRFESMVERYPGRVAVQFDGRCVTYDELNRRANQVARALVDRSGHRPEPVAILMGQGIWPMVAMVGVLKAGKFYTPFEPTSAEERLRRMLGNAGVSWIVTDGGTLELARRLAPASDAVLNLDDLPPTLPTDNLQLSIPADALACITYTSGSTGEPKGVILAHRAILANIRNYTNLIHICPDDRLSMVRSHAFNGAIKDIYGALLNGASLHPFDLARHGAAAMAGWMRAEGISLYCSVTTTWRQLISSLTGDHAFPDLRLVFIGGEPAYAEDVQRWWAAGASTCLVLFGYGISEAGHVTGILTEPSHPLASGPIPAGYATDEVRVHILDDTGCPLQPGEVGEIAVSSPALAAGYWSRPGLTAVAFRPAADGRRVYHTGDLGRLDPDGCLHHLGRMDHQAKIAGQRIELGEVESALLSLPFVDEAAAVIQPRADGENRLIAYIVAAGAAPPSVSQLRAALRARLPDAMLPSYFVTLPKLPKTPMGKVDRNNLPAPAFTRPWLDTPYAAPRSPVEDELASVWEEVLGIRGIGVHDAFFDLGGNSLLAMQVLERASRQLQVHLTLAQLFELPTVERMAAAVIEQWMGQPAKLAAAARWLDELATDL